MKKTKDNKIFSTFGKRGQLGAVQGGFYALMFMAVAVIVVTILNAFGAKFVADKQADFTTGSARYNITVSGLNAQKTLADSTGDVSDVGGISIILTLLVGVIGVFGYNRARG